MQYRIRYRVIFSLLSVIWPEIRTGQYFLCIPSVNSPFLRMRQTRITYLGRVFTVSRPRFPFFSSKCPFQGTPRVCFGQKSPEGLCPCAGVNRYRRRRDRDKRHTLYKRRGLPEGCLLRDARQRALGFALSS